MNGFERRAERKKENIRQAALQLFSVHGVQKVSMAEIAKKANVSQVTIYKYFGSKDELIYDVVSMFLEKRLQEDTQIIESDLPFPEKIKVFISKNTRDLAQLDSDFLQLMMSEEERIRQKVEEFSETKYIPLLLKLIEKGKKEGYINHQISNEAILLFISLFKEKPSMRVTPEENMKLFEDMSRLFFYGILGK
ncbi:TetR/AcrR family transcriptional regulator [Thermotalea metallivorans]|uniref:Putative HTH-type transcriptional regulator YvdT n=1 Tax=Thermotalea metallivorans TaxID=520762 RepID=A0A140KZA3_9FIRM|nr:TetR/AcrR family transcriptional regulator [Thermotalea metallivorans]KXG73628.1 putative HTH-type transcriptional regulator YvdT [Thermotalea metallivorans]